MSRQLTRSMVVVLALSLSPAWARTPVTDDPLTVAESSAIPMAGMDHKPVSDAGMNMDDKQGMTMDMSDAMDEYDMSGMDSVSMQGGAAPADARDPHAYSDGYDFGPISRPRFADEYSFGSLLIDNLETVRSDNNDAAAYDVQAWYGRDYDRAVFKAEGDIDGGELEDARTELLWGHAVSTFWDTQLGVRIDSGVAPDRGWLAFGIQGLAPYWFGIDVTAYVGDKGRSALRLDSEYELLITQMLILQPRLEADFYGKRDAGRALGAGLSDLSAGIRLRYEIRREFAPYIGIEWAGQYGGTADYARAANLDTKETRAVAGVRVWF